MTPVKSRIVARAYGKARLIRSSMFVSPGSQYTEYHQRVDERNEPSNEPEPAERKGLEGDAARFARDRMQVMQTYASLGSVGLAFVFAVVMGTAIGLWLDRLTGWSPIFTLVFFVFGLVAGGLSVYRTMQRFK